MPIPTVPLIIGGVVVAISGSVAFKKWVYDPHLAPTLEAWAISFLQARGRYHEPIAVAVNEHENDSRSWAQSSAYELHPTSSIRKRTQAVQPSVDQVLFERPASPQRKRSFEDDEAKVLDGQSTLVDLMVEEEESPATPLASPRALQPQPMIQSPPQSTTYSTLLLSRASSPAAPPAPLESLDAWAAQGLGFSPAPSDHGTASTVSTNFSAPEFISSSEAESWVLESGESDEEEDWEQTSSRSRV